MHTVLSSSPPSLGVKVVPVATGHPLALVYLQDCAVPAGFASPAADYTEAALDLHDYLVSHPAATFVLNVMGDSMMGAGIMDGDKVVVDKSVTPQSGQIVVAMVDGQFTLKRLWRRGLRVELRAENPAYAPIVLVQRQDEVQDEVQELYIWGVVVGLVRKYGRGHA